jgi:hypothetical protein
MSEDPTIDFGCNDDFAELCALSTTGSLTPDEWRRLDEHVLVCAGCAALLVNYKSLASDGMAKLGAVLSSTRAEFNEEFPWGRERAKARLLSSLGASPVGPALQRPDSGKTAPADGVFGIAHLAGLSRASALLGAAALLILATSIAFQIGLKRGTNRAAYVERSNRDTEASLREQLAALQAQRPALDDKLVADSKTIGALEGRAARAEQELAQLQALKESLESKTRELGAQNQQQSTSVAALSTERESLQQKLRDAESVLQVVRQDLKASQDERQNILLHSANLEAQIDRLSTGLRESEEASRRQEQYLASDRDIRELMGARQLYIADVFDIDPQGKTKKPFGRVFYTRGKSLIFYAFDLDQQPGFRETGAFQAWGRPGSSLAAPVSLGIFYMDNESNRRWALKFADPKVLEEINAVFVTVEPKGGSKKPTNKPFLLAYLHTAPPNHP